MSVYDFFPELIDLAIIPIFAAIALNPEETAYLIKNRIYGMAMAGDIMEIVMRYLMAEYNETIKNTTIFNIEIEAENFRERQEERAEANRERLAGARSQLKAAVDVIIKEFGP